MLPSVQEEHTNIEIHAPEDAQYRSEDTNEIPPVVTTCTAGVRDPRPHFSVVFCGHVDAGKSTLAGSLMLYLGHRDEASRSVQGGEGYGYVPYGLHDAYRAVPCGVGRGYFETNNRRITIFDGQRGFTSLMGGGTVQVDLAVLVISARMGEFEAGFDRGGPTQEHIKLLRTCSVRNVVCVINKMDILNQGPAWSEERYDHILGKLRPFLLEYDYREDDGSLVFIPVSALANINLMTKPKDNTLMPWYNNGPCLMGYIDGLVLVDTRSEGDVLAVPLTDSFGGDGGGITLVGRCASGSFGVGDKLQILPSKREVVVESIVVDGMVLDGCYPRDDVCIRVRGPVSPVRCGDVLTSIPTSLRAVEYIQARVTFLPHMRDIASKGRRFTMLVHAAQEEVLIHELLAIVDKKSGPGTPIVLKRKPLFVKAGDTVMVRLELDRPLVVEEFTTFDRLARFMLRENGTTVALGYCTKLYESTKEQIAHKDRK